MIIAKATVLRSHLGGKPSPLLAIETDDHMSSTLPVELGRRFGVARVLVQTLLATFEAVRAEPPPETFEEARHRVLMPVLRPADRGVLGRKRLPSRERERRDLLDEAAVLCPARRDALLAPFDVARVEERDEAIEKVPYCARASISSSSTQFQGRTVSPKYQESTKPRASKSQARESPSRSPGSIRSR